MANRMVFAARSLPPIRSLILGDLNVGDVIVSRNGLEACITSYDTDRYYVDIIDGVGLPANIKTR